jgi:hypothetical protein
MLDDLAFLPTSDVSAGFDYLWEYRPEGLEPLIDYFSTTYVSGTYRRIRQPAGQDGVIPPSECGEFLCCFLLSCGIFMWTMHGGSITNNNGFPSLVGHSYPTRWRTIDSIRKNQSNVDTDVLLGNPPRQRRHVKSLQSTLFNICRCVLDWSKSIESILK